MGSDFTVCDGRPSMTMPAAYAAIKYALSILQGIYAPIWDPIRLGVNVVSPGGIFDNQNLPGELQ